MELEIFQTKFAPAKRRLSNIFAWDKYVYVFGGSDGGDYNPELKKMYKFHIFDQIWTEVKDTNTPSQRSSASLAQSKDKIYLFGGYSFEYSSETNDIFEFSCLKNEWKKIPHKNGPSGRYSHSSCIIDDNMYVYGGSFTNITINNEIWKFNIPNSTWERIIPKGKQPKSAYGHTCVSYNGSMYVFGGCIDYKASNKVFEYNPKLNTYQEIITRGDLPCVRYEQAMVLFQSKFFIYGGNHQNLNEVYKDFFEFDIETGIWKKFNFKNSYSMCLFNGTLLNDSIYFFGGSDENEQYRNTFSRVKLTLPCTIFQFSKSFSDIIIN